MLSRPPVLFLRKWLEFFCVELSGTSWLRHPGVRRGRGDRRRFSPPVAFHQRGQCQIGSHIVSSSFYAVQNHIVFLQFGDFLPSPLRTEICGVFRQFVIVQAVIDLIEERRDRVGVLVFQTSTKVLIHIFSSCLLLTAASRSSVCFPVTLIHTSMFKSILFEIVFNLGIPLLLFDNTRGLLA